MNTVFENDELNSPEIPLNPEFDRSEGEASWDNEEIESPDEAPEEIESTVDEPVETQENPEVDVEDLNPEGGLKSSDDSGEEKNTPQIEIRRVLSYSDFISSN